MSKGSVLRVLGSMSGTSLDGVDAAVLETDGERILGFGPSDYRAYTSTEREVIRAAFGQWSGPEVEAAADVVTSAHIDLLSQFEDIDLIGFHGQTLSHDPAHHRTLQAGSGERLAEMLGCPVVHDFRSADVSAGGQGAPLAPFYHHACARWMKEDKPVAFLNLGGIANLTWCDPYMPDPSQDGAILAFDTGPANAPLNDLMKTRLGLAEDQDGRLSAAGHVDETIVAAVLTDPFYSDLPPKSLDRLDVVDLVDRVGALSDADAAATLCAVIAATVAAGVRHCPSRPGRLFVTGGGRHNPVMMAMIAARTEGAADPVEAVGLNGDMLEAQAFAFLAARVLRGLPTSAPGSTGVTAPICGGFVTDPGKLAKIAL
ncbi:anhydro-N-acetylmuramic acid kinase [Aestuariibius insulae]|uniref:anhydro-N-acetylmuramic acid kinase n=1 Tax=Aestuariibius insulae TaxID=2058287 RepID=UPI00345E82BD